MARQELEQAIAALGLTVTAEFVPFSKSRKKSEKTPSLNWSVTLYKNKVKILATDYGAGCGHAPSYSHRQTIAVAESVAWECEHGFPARFSAVHGRAIARENSKPILPDTCDVIHSLVSDSDVIDYATYEEWARGLGYDEDSRKGETIYRACLEIALRLRAAIDDDGLAKLREAGQDY